MDSTTIMAEWSPGAGATEYYTQRVIIAVIVIVVFIVGILGNTLVILAVTLSRRLRSPTNWFVVNLAATDFITGVFLPFQVVALLSRQGWPINDWICSVSGGITFICVTSSTTNLALIAFSRWCLLTKPPGGFQKMFERKKMFLMVSLTWLYAVLLVILPPLLGVGGLGYNLKFNTCTLMTASPRGRLYSTILAIGMFLLPTILIVTFYVLIYRFVRHHNRKRASHAKKTTSANVLPHDVSSMNEIPLKNAGNEQGRLSPTQIASDAPASTPTHPSTSSSRDHQVMITKKLAVIVCVFFACFVPIMISTALPSELSEHLDNWADLLVIINSCLNPIIYARTIPAFREVMGCIVKCRFASIPEPVDFIRRLR